MALFVRNDRVKVDVEGCVPLVTWAGELWGGMETQDIAASLLIYSPFSLTKSSISPSYHNILAEGGLPVLGDYTNCLKPLQDCTVI